MKLVIEVKEEDYKRYKEDRICSYASAVLDAVSLNEMLDEIRNEILELTDTIVPEHVWNVDVLQIIDKYREGEL